MIEKFLTYYSLLQVRRQSLVLELTYDNCCGWCCTIIHRDTNTVIYKSDGTSLDLISAHGFVALAEWAYEELLDDVLYEL